MDVDPQAQPPAVEELVDALVDGKLASYLLDSATANELIKEISAETGLPPIAVRVAFKLLAPLVAKKVEATAGWFGRGLLRRSTEALAHLPGYTPIARKLLTLRAGLDRDVERREQLDAVLAGARSPIDIEHAEGLSCELRLGLRQLADLDSMQAYLETRFDELLARLNPQPPLTLKLLQRNEVNRLKFGALRVPFIGRQPELVQLCGFLDAPQRFTWWLVTGNTGQGKSRLALELCMRVGTAWRAGFLPEESIFDAWDSWQPESATLIVVDYVATRPEQVRRIISSLLNREWTDPLDAPVRLLLLERGKEGMWWDHLVTSDQTGYAIEQCQFAPAPLDLGPLSEDDLWAHVVEILRQSCKPLPDRGETLAALAIIDPKRRPLFAAFAADALVASGNIRGWDQDRLLRDVLARERTLHWQAARATGPYENLLCLSTMVGGASIEVLKAPQAGIELPTCETFEPSVYDAMTGVTTIDDSSSVLATLAPDILGEFFVLEFLAPPHVGTNEPADRFQKAAWRQSASPAGQFVVFLDHAKTDFLAHPTLPLLLRPASDEAYQRRFWTLLAANLIAAYGNAGRFREAKSIFGSLHELASEHPEEPDLRLHLAVGAVNLTSLHDGGKRLDDAQYAFDLLRQLGSQYQEDGVIRLLAQGATNMILAYNDAGRPDELWPTFEVLRQIASERAEDAEIRFCLGLGAFNLTTCFSDADQPDQARIAFDLLRQIAASYPEAADVRLSLARSAVNLSRVYGYAARPDDARGRSSVCAKWRPNTRRNLRSAFVWPRAA